MLKQIWLDDSSYDDIYEKAVEQLQRQVRLLQEENRMLRRMLAERPAALSCGSKRPIP